MTLLASGDDINLGLLLAVPPENSPRSGGP